MIAATNRQYISRSMPFTSLRRPRVRAWWEFGSSTLYQSLTSSYQARGFVRPRAATGQFGEHTHDRVLGVGPGEGTGSDAARQYRCGRRLSSPARSTQWSDTI